MLLNIEGKIVRRLLLNFWADPTVVRRLVPLPLEITTHDGLAVLTICLTRLAELRPKGMPAWMGIAAENMAHRVAVRVPSDDGPLDGLFIFRRDTNCGLLAQVGGRLLPAVHHLAEFDVTDSAALLRYRVRTLSAEADLTLSARLPSPSTPPDFHSTNLFESLDAASRFLRRAESGYACALRDGSLEGLRLALLHAQFTPAVVLEAHSAFFANPHTFPEGSVGFDSAFLMEDPRPLVLGQTDNSSPELAGLSA